MWRVLKLIPLWLLRPLPPLGWWLLKRLPASASEWFLLKLTAMLYGEFAEVGRDIDDGLLEVLFDPAVEWIQPATFPDTQAYHGYAGVREELATFKTAWSDFSSTVRSASLDPARETLYLRIRHEGRGRVSGVDTGFEEYHLYHVRHGRVWKLEMFTDERAALEARSAGATRGAEA